MKWKPEPDIRIPSSRRYADGRKFEYGRKLLPLHEEPDALRNHLCCQVFTERAVSLAPPLTVDLTEGINVTNVRNVPVAKWRGSSRLTVDDGQTSFIHLATE